MRRDYIIIIRVIIYLFVDIMKAIVELRAHLRWLSSAQALIGRPDRKRALRARAGDLDERIRTMSEVYIRGLGELEGSEDPEREVRFEADYKQCLDMADAIREAVAALDEQGKVGLELVGDAGSGIASKLPALNLPTFSGGPGEWMGFRGMFMSLVDSRVDLSATQKLAYLRAALQGEAEEVIRHLDLNDASYTTARELLDRRYHNIRRMAEDQVGVILDLPRVGSPGMGDLRLSFLHPLLAATNALRALSLPVDEWSFLLLSVCLRKLPPEMRVRFEGRFGGTDSSHLPPFADLIIFLEDECRQRETATSYEAARGGGCGGRGAPVGGGSAKAGRGVRGTRGPSYAALQRPPASGGPTADRGTDAADCPYCHGDHPVLTCGRFKRESTNRRRGFVIRARLCFYCFGQHWARECLDQRPCRDCGGDHHVLLCPAHDTRGEGVRDQRGTAAVTRARAGVSPRPPRGGGSDGTTPGGAGPRPYRGGGSGWAATGGMDSHSHGTDGSEWDSSGGGSPRSGTGWSAACASPRGQSPVGGTNGSRRVTWANPQECATMTRQPGGPARTFSPPVAERPRLARDPASIGRHRPQFLKRNQRFQYWSGYGYQYPGISANKEEDEAVRGPRSFSPSSY